MPARYSLILSCEHGGRCVPPDYATLFAGHEAILDSHRGWDPGALDLGEQLAEALDVPLFGATTTRLLIDLNRSIGHRQLFSEFTRVLPRAQRDAIVRAYYRPHRDRIEHDIARRIADGESVIHIASHSFTPVLNGITRRADIGWLYDPKRPREARLARRWMDEVEPRGPGLRLRRNYPYLGSGDGLATLLRRRHPANAYLGIELEVNQHVVGHDDAAWAVMRQVITVSLAAALAGWRD